MSEITILTREIFYRAESDSPGLLPDKSPYFMPESSYNPGLEPTL